MNSPIRIIANASSFLIGYGIYGYLLVHPRVGAIKCQLIDLSKFLGEALREEYVRFLVREPKKPIF